MKDKDPKGNPMEIYLVVLVLAAALFYKILPVLVAFWNRHMLAIKLGLALGVLTVGGTVGGILWNRHVAQREEDSIVGPDDTSVLLGYDMGTGLDVHLKQAFRPMHAQVIGTTNAGKSESATLPWAIQDIENGSGLLFIDGKSDGAFLQKLYGYVCRYNREADFRLFALNHVAQSSSFNPLRGDSPQEVTERVFSSFTFENEYYRNIQYKLFLAIVRLVFAQKEVPTFSLIQRLLTDAEEMAIWVQACPDDFLKKEMTRFLKLSEKEREERVSGLEAIISNFTSSEVASLFEETDNRIDMNEALAQGHILYFQLPTMYYPFLASATGKLVLQCFQSAVSKRQTKLLE